MPKGVRGFQKGQSGNPGGRPKKQYTMAEARELLAPLVPKARDVLEKILDDGKYDSDKIKAATLILERVYGRPNQLQQVEHSGEVGHKVMVDRPPPMSREEWLEAHKPKPLVSIVETDVGKDAKKVIEAELVPGCD